MTQLWNRSSPRNVKANNRPCFSNIPLNAPKHPPIRFIQQNLNNGACASKSRKPPFFSDDGFRRNSSSIFLINLWTTEKRNHRHIWWLKPTLAFWWSSNHTDFFINYSISILITFFVWTEAILFIDVTKRELIK